MVAGLAAECPGLIYGIVDLFARSRGPTETEKAEKKER